MRLILWVMFGAILSGCTSGHTHGQNRPGATVYLPDGSIATSPDRGRAFYLDRSGSRRILWAADIYGSREAFADVSGLRDLRILFPPNQILVMGERDEHERLILFDAESLTELRRVAVRGRYHGTRLSPSGRFLLVSDNQPRDANLQLIDLRTLQIEGLAYSGGHWTEAGWLNGRDVLVGMVAYGGNSRGQSESTQVPQIRLEAWSFEGEETEQISLWPGSEHALVIPNVRHDDLHSGSQSWICMSPDDRYAAVQVLQETPLLLVVDLRTGELRVVQDVRGPVGFSPDGATIVGYRAAPGDDQDEYSIVEIELPSLQTTETRIPFEGPGLLALRGDDYGPLFYVTESGRFVVIGSNVGDQPLLVFDRAQRVIHTVTGRRLRLNEFVVRRGEHLYIVDDGLFHLDLNEMRVAPVRLGWTPEHINILVTDDILVLDDEDRPGVFFFNPDGPAPR